MSAQDLTSYVAIAVGGVAAMGGIAAVLRKDRPPTRLVVLLFAGGLLFLFGGGYGLSGIDSAGRTLAMLVGAFRVQEADGGSHRHS